MLIVYTHLCLSTGIMYFAWGCCSWTSSTWCWNCLSTHFSIIILTLQTP